MSIILNVFFALTIYSMAFAWSLSVTQLSQFADVPSLKARLAYVIISPLAFLLYLGMFEAKDGVRYVYYHWRYPILCGRWIPADVPTRTCTHA